MKQSFLKLFFIFIFTSFAVTYSYAQNEISESFSKTYDIYRTWTKGQTPGEFNRTKRIVKFEFSQNSIKKSWGNQGVMNMKWELESSYTIVQSKKMKSDNGDVVYMYSTSSGTQFGCNMGSVKNIMIFDGSKITEYISE